MTRNNSVDPRQKYHTDYIYVPVWKEWTEYLFVFQFYFIVTIRNDGFWPKRDNKHNREKKTRKPAFDAFFIFLSNKKEIRHIRKTIPRSIISFVIKCCEHFKIPNKRNSNKKKCVSAERKNSERDYFKYTRRKKNYAPRRFNRESSHTQKVA